MEVYKANINPVYINSESFVIDANVLGNPDLVQSRCDSSCRAIVCDVKNLPVDNAGRYPEYRISCGNIHLAHGDAQYHIYLCVRRQGGNTASLGYSPTKINVEGLIINEDGISGKRFASSDYFYYLIGEIGARGSDPSVPCEPKGSGRSVTVRRGVPHVPYVTLRAVDSIEIGKYNLLLNTGFTGTYSSAKLYGNTSLEMASEMFSPSLEGWKTQNAVTASDAESQSGVSVQLGGSSSVGSMSQRLPKPLIKGENYVLSFKAKGKSVSVRFGKNVRTYALTDTYERYYLRTTLDVPVSIFTIYDASCTLCELQIERGNVATDWGLNINDGNKDSEKIEDMKYVLEAMRQGDTKTLGGLILSSIIMLGKYSNGKLTDVNAGISGVCNDSDDVALWAGGNFEEAVRTIARFRENPNVMPSEEEWNNLCSWVVSHGGDNFMRGYIYALGGIFKGKVSIAEGKILLDDDGSGKVAGGNRWWNADGTMFTKAHDIIEWVSVMESIDEFSPSVHELDYKKGTYVLLDLTSSITNNIVALPEPEYDMRLSVSVHDNDPLHYRAILNAKFRYYDSSSRVYKSVTKLTIHPSAVGAIAELSYSRYWGLWTLVSPTDRYQILNDTIIIQ